MDRGADGLGQPVEHVRPQGARAFEKIAKHADIDSDRGGNLFQGLPAAMQGAAQMAAQRVLRGRFLAKPNAKARQEPRSLALPNRTTTNASHYLTGTDRPARIRHHPWPEARHC